MCLWARVCACSWACVCGFYLRTFQLWDWLEGSKERQGTEALRAGLCTLSGISITGFVFVAIVGIGILLVGRLTNRLGVEGIRFCKCLLLVRLDWGRCEFCVAKWASGPPIVSDTWGQATSSPRSLGNPRLISFWVETKFILQTLNTIESWNYC